VNGGHAPLRGPRPVARSLAVVAALAHGSLSAQAPVPVPAGSDAAAVAALAATVRPSARQLAWQRSGCNAFVHFGMNTFTDREWGDGTEDPRTFAPAGLDAGQWVAAFRAAGMRGLVLTCKHHDGFCLWPSASTEHDVANSPFRGGRGDVVAEVAAACRAGGLLFGVYLSPWDRNARSFGSKAYEALFLQQLRELCTGYGPLFEVWFDGAHCPADDPAVFDWQAVFALVRELQPDAAIAITGPDVRWVGNEAGRTRAEEWSALPLHQPAPGPFATDRQSWRALWALRERNQDQDLGSRARLAGAAALCWWPAETDVSIRPGWFHHPHEDGRVKSLPELLDCWFGAVGGNAVLLLNVPPARTGRLADPDVAVLADLGRYLEATFGQDLAAGAREARSYPRAGELYFAQPVTADLFELAEDVAGSGQRIETFRVEVLQNGGWRECARGTTVGLRRLLRTEPVTGDGFRWWVERCRAAPRLERFGLYRRPLLLAPPRIRRDRDGLVAIAGDGGELRFTCDGAPVTAASPRYTGPFALPGGGTVRAAAFPAPGGGFAPAGGSRAAAVFGLLPREWRVLSCSSEQGGAEGAASAFDGDPATHWHSRWSPDSPGPPHHLAIDLGRAATVRGFVYTMRADGDNGTIADYEFHGSADGERWQRLAAGTFGNVAANPVPQVVEFARPAGGVRYVKLVALRELRGRPWASCAELEVLGR